MKGLWSDSDTRLHVKDHMHVSSASEIVYFCLIPHLGSAEESAV